MKAIKILAMAALATAVFASCSNDEDLAQSQGGRIKMRSPPKVLTGNFRPSQLSFFLS